MIGRIRRTLKTKMDEGASAVEYGLMVAAIAAVIVAVVFGLGNLVKTSFTRTCQSIADGTVAQGDGQGITTATCPGPTPPPPPTVPDTNTGP